MRQAVQLLAPTAASVTDATLFTTPAATVTIMRQFRVCNTSGVAQTFSLAIGGTAATGANCIANVQTVAANSTADVQGYIVLPASTAVHALASATTVTFAAWGDQSVAGG